MNRFQKRPILRHPGRIKGWWYRRGHRPKPGSLLYSPTLAMFYAGQEFGQRIRENWEASLRQMEQDARERSLAEVVSCTCGAIEYGAMAPHLKPCPLSDDPPNQV